MTSTPRDAAVPDSAHDFSLRATSLSARINGWMRRWSWAVAMTVAIVITVGGLVILESGRMRIAAEYETALDAKGATTQLTALAADIASLTADERAFRLAPDNTYIAHYAAAAARINAGLTARSGSDAAPSTDILDSALALLRLNEERRAQAALDASRADQR